MGKYRWEKIRVRVGGGLTVTSRGTTDVVSIIKTYFKISLIKKK